MPYYDYTCECCKHEEEFFFKVKDREDAVCCTQCRGVMKRAITTPSLHGLYNSRQAQHIDDFTKNELASELQEYDQHQKQDDKRVEQLIKSGEFE